MGNGWLVRWLGNRKRGGSGNSMQMDKNLKKKNK